jgi:hypothetical protein
MNAGVAKSAQQEERRRALPQGPMRDRAGPSGDDMRAGLLPQGPMRNRAGPSGDDMRAGPMSAEVTGTEFCASFKENLQRNADPCIPAGESCPDALDNIRAGKCDPAALCAMEIEPEGDIVQLPQLGDLDTLANYVQASLMPFIHEFDANSMLDEQDVQRVGKLETPTVAFCKHASFCVRLRTAEASSDSIPIPTGYDTSAALTGFSEICNGFSMQFEKSFVKKKGVCSVCGAQGHNKRSCFKIMNLR